MAIPGGGSSLRTRLARVEQLVQAAGRRCAECYPRPIVIAATDEGGLGKPCRCGWEPVIVTTGLELQTS